MIYSHDDLLAVMTHLKIFTHTDVKAIKKVIFESHHCCSKMLKKMCETANIFLGMMSKSLQ